jgi:hypothetical protein
MRRMSSMDEDRRLRRLYEAFNARDIDAVLDAMTDDVDWPNAWEGGRLRGKGPVRDYWNRQWAEIDPRVEPASVAALSDGRFAVDVDQTVRDRAGSLLGSGRVRHVYTLVDGLVARMDVEPEASAQNAPSGSAPTGGRVQPQNTPSGSASISASSGSSAAALPRSS